MSRNIPEELRLHLRRGESLKSRVELVKCYHNAFIIQGAAVWTPTILKVNDKDVVGVGRHGRWQQFGRIF